MRDEDQRAGNFSSPVSRGFDGFHVGWLVGSSITSTFGFCSISLPNSMRPCSPPEMTLTGFFTSSPEEQAAEIATDPGFQVAASSMVAQA